MAESIPFDREGSFRGVITEYALQDAKNSQSVGVACKFVVHEFWNPELEQWEDWRPFNMEGFGTTWIIKKDGQLNSSACESLIKSAGWDGDLNAIAEQRWQPKPLQWNTSAEAYEGKTSFRPNFLSEYDAAPGGPGLRHMDGAKAQSLAAQFGAQLRALAGNAKAKAAPTGKPTAPPAAPKPAPAPAPAAVAANAERSGDIPF